MSRIVSIPGGSASIRDAKDVKQRARRRLELAAIAAGPLFDRVNARRRQMSREQGREVLPSEVSMMELGLAREDMDLLYEIQTATILAYLESWTLDQDLPRTQEDLDELPAELYDALQRAVAQDGADAVAPVSFDPDPAPDSPTGDGSGSVRPSLGELESPSIPRSPVSGESLPTDRPLAAA